MTVCASYSSLGSLALLLLINSGLAAPPASHELPADLDQALTTIEDFTYDFDHPAYYRLLEFVQNSPQAPGFAAEPIAVDDWRTLIERPADYRGLPVTVEGVVGRNKDPYTHPRHPELHPYHKSSSRARISPPRAP